MLDPFTGDTLRAMRNHPWSDAKVARYLGISEAVVARSRGTVSTRPLRIERRSSPNPIRWTAPLVKAVFDALPTKSRRQIAEDLGIHRGALDAMIARERKRGNIL